MMFIQWSKDQSLPWPHIHHSWGRSVCVCLTVAWGAGICSCAHTSSVSVDPVIVWSVQREATVFSLTIDGDADWEMEGEPTFVASNSTVLHCYNSYSILSCTQIFPPSWYMNGERRCFGIVVTLLLALMGFKLARGIRDMHVLWTISIIVYAWRSTLIWKGTNITDRINKKKKKTAERNKRNVM